MANEHASRPLWWRLALVTAVVAGGLTAGTYWVATVQQPGRRLANHLAALDRAEPGWRLRDLVEARPEVPPAENAALVVVAVGKGLPKDWMDFDLEQQLASVAPPEALHPEVWKAFMAEMDLVRDLLPRARRLADLPRGRHRIDVTPDPDDMRIEDVTAAREAARLLRYDAWGQAQSGDVAAALRSGRAGLNVARSLSDDPVLISQLVRVACVALALGGIERSLALGVATDADLAATQRLVEAEARHPTLLVTLRGVRATEAAHLEAVVHGTIPFAKALERSRVVDPSAVPEPTWVDRLFGPSRREYYEHQLTILEYMDRLVEMARLPPEDWAAQLRALDADAAALPSRAAVVRQHLKMMRSLITSMLRQAASARALAAALAVERHRLRHGKWPATLAEAFPVALDPFDGQPLRYRRLADAVVVYSIGEEKVDLEGALESWTGSVPRRNYGYRLWDIDKRRQPGKAPVKEPPQEDGR